MVKLRGLLRGSRAADKLHWNDLSHRQQRIAAKQVAAVESFHIVAIGSPVPTRKQERARATCLTRLVHELHSYGVTDLLMEARARELNARDIRTVTGARFQLPKGCRFRIDHEFGAREPLLWIADMIAGAVRANRLGDPRCHELLADLIYEIEVDTKC